MEQQYGQVTTEIVEELKKIVGEKNTVFEDKAKLKEYGMDTLSLITGVVADPEIAVKPESAAQVSAIMKLASQHKIPVTARGAGTGLAGSAIPTSKGIVRVPGENEQDPGNRYGGPGGGCRSRGDHQRPLPQGGGIWVMYAGYPMSTESSFIGGKCVNNAGGAKVIKYGNTRNIFLDWRWFWPTERSCSSEGVSERAPGVMISWRPSSGRRGPWPLLPRSLSI